MLAAELAEFIADILDVPCGTVLDRAKALRAVGLLSKGKQGPYGGAQMTSADAVNSILVNVIGHKRGEDIVTNVRRVRALPARGAASVMPAGFATGLAFCDAPRAGAALDSVLDDMRTARFATWAAGESYRLSVALENRGRLVAISLDKPKRDEMDFRLAMHAFATPERTGRPALIERQTAIEGEIFRRLAAALGPP